MPGSGDQVASIVRHLNRFIQQFCSDGDERYSALDGIFPGGGSQCLGPTIGFGEQGSVQITQERDEILAL